ncbi:unnamed protein product [Eruca vesicaria subsp. sativa]|uniref:F-box domain-containing protein n=1 Tax=Eruca vesicaria subsp. sativa TaxID=29727 RepID=A0ABC8KCC2_ERUVS|nr:unnamed protein product [Eruca vesicaria subsp. sativa]
MIFIVTDVVEKILVRLPLKSIHRFKTVSREWRSTLESRRFAERHKKSVPKKRKILAVGTQAQSQFQGDTEIEMVYVQQCECDDATLLSSLTCDSIVCIPEPNWVSVLNPSTEEFLSFCSGPFHYLDDRFTGWSTFNMNTAMGFGRDEILDVNISEWRKLVPPPYKVETRKNSACILALDLHTEEFRDVQLVPPPMHSSTAQIVNLDDRLAIADTCALKPGWDLEIWIRDAQEETWTIYDLLHNFSP